MKKKYISRRKLASMVKNFLKDIPDDKLIEELEKEKQIIKSKSIKYSEWIQNYRAKEKAYRILTFIRSWASKKDDRMFRWTLHSHSSTARIPSREEDSIKYEEYAI